MLFAPAELNPFVWSEILSEKAWNIRLSDYIAEMSLKPGMIENYSKLKKCMNVYRTEDDGKEVNPLLLPLFPKE